MQRYMATMIGDLRGMRRAHVFATTRQCEETPLSAYIGDHMSFVSGKSCARERVKRSKNQNERPSAETRAASRVPSCLGLMSGQTTRIASSHARAARGGPARKRSPSGTRASTSWGGGNWSSLPGAECCDLKATLLDGL